jgi:hypothetical protein
MADIGGILEMTKQESIKAYSDYIHTHIMNVKKVWCEVEEVLHDFGMGVDSVRMREIVRVHDESKFTEDEFEPYRQKFYLSNDEFPASREVEDRFAIATMHHYDANRHHWQYWTSYKDGNPISNKMDKLYVMEMLCDWGAMSLVRKDTVKIFYNSQRPHMVIHRETEAIIDRFIQYIDIAVERISRRKNA